MDHKLTVDVFYNDSKMLFTCLRWSFRDLRNLHIKYDTVWYAFLE